MMAFLIWVGTVSVLTFPVWGWLVRKLAFHIDNYRWKTAVVGTIEVWILNAAIIDVVVFLNVVVALSLIKDPGAMLIATWNSSWFGQWMLVLLAIGNVLAIGFELKGIILDFASDQDYHRVFVETWMLALAGIVILVLLGFVVLVANALSAYLTMPLPR